MNQPLAHYCSCASDFSRPSDPPVDDVHPSWDSTVSLVVLQACLHSSKWREGSLSLFLAHLGSSEWRKESQMFCLPWVLQVEERVTSTLKGFPASSRWREGSPCHSCRHTKVLQMEGESLVLSQASQGPSGKRDHLVFKDSIHPIFHVPTVPSLRLSLYIHYPS